MPLVIREFHPAPSSTALNEEWLVIENTGSTQIGTAGCTLSVSRGKGRMRALGTLDPGFFIKPGEKVRLVTGSPGKKAQGTPPPEAEGVRNYHLFLKEAVLHEGLTVHLLLKQHPLCSAEYHVQQPQQPAPV
jgi:hypothetical protein